MTAGVPASTPCASCRGAMVNATDWGRIPREDRRELIQQGFRRMAARGVCANCYQFARTTGQIAMYAPTRHHSPEPIGSGHCVRCGIASSLKDGLCVDCVVVTTDLAELARWAS